MEITKRSKCFDGIRAIASCVSKDKKRIYNDDALCFVFVDDKYVVGCDGRVCIRAERTDEIEPGYYKVIKNTQKEVYLEKRENDYSPKYPDYKAVLAGKEVDENDSLLSGDLSVDHARIGFEGVCVSFDYLKLFEGLDMTWRAYGSKMPVYFKNTTIDGVIMPIKM